MRRVATYLADVGEICGGLGLGLGLGVGLLALTLTLTLTGLARASTGVPMSIASSSELHMPSEVDVFSTTRACTPGPPSVGRAQPRARL